MEYSLTPYSQTIANTSVGDIDLSTDQVITLLNTTAAQIPVPASGTTSGTLVLDSDLGARIHVDEVRYYFGTSVSGNEVMPYITFSVKNESFESYTDLVTQYNDIYYYATISGTPRHIRVHHTVVSGVGGLVNGLQVMNDETLVDFGEDGTKTFYNVNASIDDTLVQVDELAVFNSGPTTANAKIILEPQNDISDTILSLSTTETGPWQGIYSDDDLVSGDSIWDSGTYDNVSIQGNNLLKLDGGETEGTYRTRIINVDEDSKLTFSVIQNNYPIVIPEIEFFDDFSAADTQWNWSINLDDQLDFSAGYIHYYDPSGNGLTIVTTKDLGMEYTDDFDLTFQYVFQEYQVSGDDWGQFMYFMWPKTDFYLRHYTNLVNNWTDLHLNGTNYSLSSKWNWPSQEGKWLNLRLNREFTSIRLKIWEVGQPEPGSWDWTGTIQAGSVDVPLEGGIRMRFQYIWSNRHVYYDNFKLIKNYSASAGGKSIIATDDTDTLENIEVRSSNQEPKPYNTYIAATGSYGAETMYTSFYWLEDGTLADQSADWGRWGRSGNYWEYWYDSVSEDEYIVDKPFYTGYYGDTAIIHMIRRKGGGSYTKTLTSPDYDYQVNYSTYKWIPNYLGESWCYFYLKPAYTHDTGYFRLRYYSATLGTSYERTANDAQGSFMYDLDCAYNSTDLWYTDSDLSTVFKIDKTGSIVTSYLATSSITGVVAEEDGGCWVIQEGALLKITSDGELEASYSLNSTTVSFIYKDPDGGFWLHDGEVIRHLNADIEEDFTVSVPNLWHITPAIGGVLTKHHDGSTSTRPKAGFVSSNYKRMVREWDYPATEGGWKGSFDYNRYGVKAHKYDDLVEDHAAQFPVAIDSEWVNKPWRKVSLRDHNFSNEQYHQMRITLRADNSNNSPEVGGIWTQKAITVNNIYPGNYGNFYMKTDISELNNTDTGSYSPVIRAFWYLDAE